MWYGSAAVSVNEQRQFLMVKQGKPEKPKTWALPAGGRESEDREFLLHYLQSTNNEEELSL